jgi:hypothetical protein
VRDGGRNTAACDSNGAGAATATAGIIGQTARDAR